jgi:hypothetical protein
MHVKLAVAYSDTPITSTLYDRDLEVIPSELAKI